MFAQLKIVFFIFFRAVGGISPRLLSKAVSNWFFSTKPALSAFRTRKENGEFFPPFLSLSLTKKCSQVCRGCWSCPSDPSVALAVEEADRAIREAKRREVRFVSLQGGEPFLWPDIWHLIEDHPDCYFQLVTNGLLLTPKRIAKIKNFGNVSPLVSLDGFRVFHDARRGEGSYDKTLAGCRKLGEAKILFGVATVVTAKNLKEVLSDDFVLTMVDAGAFYLAYSLYRPVGPDLVAEWRLDAEAMADFRRRLRDLRGRLPILLVDSVWDVEGQRVCPAASGIGVSIGPEGEIRPCPPLTVFRDKVTDHFGDLAKTFSQSDFLRHFRAFVRGGCPILEKPRDLAAFLREEKVEISGAADFLTDLEKLTPGLSRHLSDETIPEEMFLYRYLKKRFFFGMGLFGG